MIAIGASGRSTVSRTSSTCTRIRRGLLASLHLNWLSPVKIRHFLAGCSRRSILYNDLDISERLKVYDRGVDVSRDPAGLRDVLIVSDGRRRLAAPGRDGALVPHGRALRRVHRRRAAPISGGEQGCASCAPWRPRRNRCRAAASACALTMQDFNRIAPDVRLGRDVKIFGFANLYGCSVGDDSRIGCFVEIQKNAVVGARCKISSHAFICEGVVIEDEVFIGHHVLHQRRLPRACRPTARCAGRRLAGGGDAVRRRASIGSGAVILPGSPSAKAPSSAPAAS